MVFNCHDPRVIGDMGHGFSESHGSYWVTFAIYTYTILRGWRHSIEAVKQPREHSNILTEIWNEVIRWCTWRRRSKRKCWWIKDDQCQGEDNKSSSSSLPLRQQQQQTTCTTEPELHANPSAQVIITRQLLLSATSTHRHNETNATRNTSILLNSTQK